MSGLAGFTFALAASILAMAVAAGLLALVFRGWTWIADYWRTSRHIGLMRRAGRYLSRAEFEEHLARSAGTVLIEYSTADWRGLRVWWTSEDVVALARAAGFPERLSPADGRTPTEVEVWLRDRYLDREHGRALLVPIYEMGGASTTFASSLRSRSPAPSVIDVRSAVAA